MCRGEVEESTKKSIAGENPINALIQDLDQNLQFEGGKTELHDAAEKGNLQLVESLLEDGADLTKKSRRGWTALHYAVKSCDLETVKYLALTQEKCLISIKSNAGSTALHMAAVYAGEDVCKFFIENGVDAAAFNSNGMNAMHNACRKGNLESLRYLLSQEEFFNLDEKTRKKQGALHLATTSGNLNLIEFLMNRGLDCNEPDSKKYTPFLIAVVAADVSFVRFFVEHGADLHSKNGDGKNAMHLASQEGRLKTLKYLVSVAKYNVCEKDMEGNQAIHLAVVVSEHLGIVDFLLENGADIDARTVIRDLTPLLLAAQNCKLETFKFLLERGADLNAEDNMYHDAFHKACDGDNLEVAKYLVGIGKFDLNKRNINGKTPWIKLARNESVEFKRYLVELGADIHSTDNFNLCALTIAAQFGDVQNCRYLLSLGLDFDVLTKEGGNALHQTCISGNVSTARFIIDLGRLDVNGTFKNGLTPLHVAASKSHIDMIKMLLEKGADIRKKNDHGLLPFHSAARSGDMTTVKYFVDNGFLDEKTFRNETALLLSCYNKHSTVTQYLFEKGSDPNVVDSVGRNLFLVACFANIKDTIIFLIKNGFDPSVENKYGEGAVHIAAKKNNVGLMKYLVEEQKLSVNQLMKNRSTLLHSAAEFGGPSACSWLLLHPDVDVRAENRNGNDALQCACAGNMLENVRVLWDSGKFRVNKKNKFGHTVLHLAAEKGSLDLVQFLVETAGADVTRADFDKWTPVHVAAKFADLEVNEYLVSKQDSALYQKNCNNHLPLDVAAQNRDKSVLEFYESRTKIVMQDFGPKNEQRGGWRNERNQTSTQSRNTRDPAYGHQLFNSNWRS
ncbi:ankyrin-3-like [Neocloeon triangulifer]|uniref:ankyrin-3-like n=1 Tax=Neocloeon triangulifer TaxID=2078957 RepID=UPI00286F48AE|nr:ankyrin-3-like [Neocloeon triangulifer]XP_059486306.1 ankyrin-3-like [Neocloeon triangulifer]